MNCDHWCFELELLFNFCFCNAIKELIDWLIDKGMNTMKPKYIKQKWKTLTNRSDIDTLVSTRRAWEVNWYPFRGKLWLRRLYQSRVGRRGWRRWEWCHHLCIHPGTTLRRAGRFPGRWPLKGWSLIGVFFHSRLYLFAFIPNIAVLILLFSLGQLLQQLLFGTNKSFSSTYTAHRPRVWPHFSKNFLQCLNFSFHRHPKSS